MKRKPIYTLLFLLVFLGVTSLAFAEEYTFTNMDGITINDNAAATPYPSEITIPDNTIPGNVTDVTVTLYHLTHTNPDDIRVLLVSPLANVKVLVMANVGGTNDVTDVTLSFNDNAAAPLHTDDPIFSGVYLISNPDSVEGVSFPATAPAAPYATTLGSFNGLNGNTNLNGTWSLYVWDDTAGSTGSIDGWSLAIYDNSDACQSSEVPALVSPADNATDVPVLTEVEWDAVPGAFAYYFNLCSDAACIDVLDEDFLPSTDTSWGGFNLVGGTTYYWRLRSALGSCGSSGWSQIWKFTTTGACAVPDVPELSSPTNGATGQSTTPLLDWTSESGADSYDVEVCENSSCSSSVTGIVNVPGSSWEVTPALTEGETYYWRARSRDTTCGPSAWTGTWSFTVEDISCPVPDVPELSSPANGATVPTTTPLLDWTSESGADSYDVEVCENSSCSSSVTGIVNVPGSSWEVTPALTEGETYYWRARSRDTTCGPSAWTGTRSFTVSCTEPGVPSLISPANNAPDVSQAPLLNWSDVAGASTYNVRVCNDSNCSGIIRLENDLTESQWMVTPELTEGAVAWWQAQAVNACDESDWSTAWTFTVCTPPGSPTQLSPANGSMFVSPTPILDWTDASGATSYTVELCADSACTTVLNSATVASSQWNITSPLDLGMHYWWRVSANTGCGSSPWLGTWDFITSLAPRVMDFNNDMMPDILWQHQERSDIYVWYMDGLLAIGGASLGTVTDPDWQIVNADDFGSADILWQHLTRGDLSLWMMDGINIIGEDDIGRVSDPDWRIVSTEDFDGDGNLDFLWQHQIRADIYIWFMDDNVDWLDSLSLGTVSDKSWKIAGTGDFDGDFKPDILWYHAVRGDVYLWFMDGVTFLDGKHIGTVADTDWQIKATDDYNGDLSPDILWQNVVTGEISAWLMDNDEILAITDVATLSDPDWMIVAPK